MMVAAQLLQSDLAQIGLKLDIRVMEWGEMLKRAKNGEHDLVSAGWGGTTDRTNRCAANANAPYSPCRILLMRNLPGYRC